MRKFFYMVWYSYSDGDIVSSFDLGIFSTKKNAEKKIAMSKDLPGFKKYGNLFKLIKFSVNYEIDAEKKDATLYCVWLEHDDCYEIFDFFSSFQRALEKIEFYKKHTRIGRKYSNLFQISDTKVDNYNSWSEGFM